MSETTESPDPEDTPSDEPTTSEPTEQGDDRSAVMLLGSGELSRELTLAFQRLGRRWSRSTGTPMHLRTVSPIGRRWSR